MGKKQQRASPPAPATVEGPPKTSATEEAKSESGPEVALEPRVRRLVEPVEVPPPPVTASAIPHAAEVSLPPPEKPLVFEITLIEGATYKTRRGQTFVGGQPVVTSDPELIAFARGSSRFRVEQRRGAA